MNLTISPATNPIATLSSVHKHPTANASAILANDNPASVVNLSQATQSQYDFTQMTPQQMQATMNDLIRSGKMSLDASSVLVCMIPTPLSKPVYDGQTPITYSQPMNFIAALQAGLAGAQARNDDAGAAAVSKALATLQSLQGTSMQS